MAHINTKQLERVASALRNEDISAKPMNFHSYPDGQRASEAYPDIGDPGVIPFFFFTILHQFGFWYGEKRGYLGPLYGTMNGKKVKGADLLFAASMRAFVQRPSMFEPEFLASISPDVLFRSIFVDDGGPIPFPDLEERLIITREYGAWFVDNFTTPEEIIAQANRYENPLHRFLQTMSGVGGFDRDPLRKRQALLAMVLANRPEQFLRVDDETTWPPVIDYHVMRVMLRLGIVELSGSEIKANTECAWVTKRTERGIRNLTFRAVNLLSTASKIPMPALDHLLWKARRYCPEVLEPDCSKCIFNDVCEKKIDRFQPVYRTTDY